MIRKKKIRGHKRIQKKIKKWIEVNRVINIQDFLLNKYCYAYLYVEPYCNISLENSIFPEPKGKTRKVIILGLEEIYNNWKLELNKLNVDYLLKIYLFEPNISKSQVICAIGDKVEYYENYFRKINLSKHNFNLHKVISCDFKWESYSDDFIYSEQELLTPIEYYVSKEDYNYSIKLLNKLRDRNYTKIGIDTNEGSDNLYYVPQGKVWIGGK